MIVRFYTHTYIYKHTYTGFFVFNTYAYILHVNSCNWAHDALVHMNRTSCAQVYELPWGHCGDNQEETLFSWLHMHYAHLAFVRFEHSVIFRFLPNLWRLKFINFVVKFICSGIYITITGTLQSLAKQKEAYLVQQTCKRGEGANLASSVEHFPKWYLYGSLRMATLQRWARGLSKSTSAGSAAL